MSRLVDADELKLELKWLKIDTPVYHDVMSTIDEMPTVNAVEVVRCKDCRWFENDGYHTNCQIIRFCVEADDYCSRGERREDEKINRCE